MLHFLQIIDDIFGTKSIDSNIKFFISQLICILAGVAITFGSVGIFLRAVVAVSRGRVDSLV